MKACKAAPDVEWAVLFDFISTKNQGPIRALHLSLLKLLLVFVGTTEYMLTPQQSPASSWGQKTENRTIDRHRKDGTIKNKSSEKMRVTLKKEIPDVIHGWYCLEVIVPALHPILR